MPQGICLYFDEIPGNNDLMSKMFWVFENSKQEVTKEIIDTKIYKISIPKERNQNILDLAIVRNTKIKNFYITEKITEKKGMKAIELIKNGAQYSVYAGGTYIAGTWWS